MCGLFFSVQPWKLWPVCFLGHPWKHVLGIFLALDVVFRVGFIVPFENIALTASMAANCELQMLAGTYLSAAVENCMACVILDSAVICGCLRYQCKYSAVSVIINAFVSPSIAFYSYN